MANGPDRTPTESGKESPEAAAGLRLRLGSFVLEPATRRLLSADGLDLRLGPKPFQVLLHLVENRHRLVPRDELLARFWTGGGVYDEALTRCMSSIRKALDDQGDTPRYLETRWAEGYRYIGPCDEEQAPEGVVATPAAAHRFLWPTLLVALTLAIGAVTYWRSSRPDPGPAKIKRLAVLPPRGADAADAWLAEGLGDQLINSLSRIEGLTVIARGSTIGYRDGTPDPAAIGRELGVDAFLAMTVALDPETVRVTARLTATSDGRVVSIFGTEYPRADMMKAEREIAISIADQLAARLHEAPRAARDELAYDHFLRGRYLWKQRTERSLTQAIAEYEAALAADPEYAEAHAGLAEALLMLPLYAGRPPAETRPQARAAAETALRLDPLVGRAHLVLGVITQFDWDWAAADAHFREAVAINPSDATARQWGAESLCYRRRFDECVAGLREAQSLDPLSPVIAMVQMTARRWSGDHQGAAAGYLQIAERWPSFAFIGFERGKALVASGEAAAAIPYYETALPTLGIGLVGGPLIYAYARAGRRDEAVALNAKLEAHAAAHHVSSATRAIAALGLGDRDAALTWVERTVAERDELALYLAVDEHFTELRDEPRFRAALAAMGLGGSPR